MNNEIGGLDLDAVANNSSGIQEGSAIEAKDSVVDGGDPTNESQKEGKF